MKKHLLTLITLLLSLGMSAQTTVTFTAAEIVAGTTKSGITVSTDLAIKTGAQICKPNGKKQTADVVEVKNTAATVDQYYVQVSATADISHITVTCNYNSSGSAKDEAMLMWSTSNPSASTPATTETLFSVAGYEGDCSNRAVSPSIPSGIKSLRMYRQVKKYSTSSHSVVASGGANYGSGQTFYVESIEVTTNGGGTPTVSTDATLSDLQVDGQTVAGFAAGTTSYNVTIPATQTAAPVVAATANHPAAEVNITQAQLPTATQSTTASVIVTAEDGTSTKTYTITFTRAQLSHDADLQDIKVNGQSITGFSAATTSYNVQVPYSTTSTIITATTNHSAATTVINNPTGATGTATIVVTAEDGTTTKTYTLNITKAPASNDASLRELKYNNTSVPNFSANTLSYSVELPYGTTTPAHVAAVANYAAATVQVTQPTAAVGTATVVVTAEDGTATKTYTISFTVAEEDVPPVPPTTLTLHTPGIYEEKSLAGGYNTPLTIVSGREYEVYYMNRDNNSNITVTTTNIEKAGAITTNNGYNMQTTDGWFKMSTTDGGSSEANNYGSEFGTTVRRLKITSSNSIELHIKGFDQFSFVAKDKKKDTSSGGTKPADDRYLEIYIDNILQPAQFNSSFSIRRYNITTGEHVIRIIHHGTEQSEFAAFSLRVAQEPRLKKVKGNDSTQNVLATTAMKPITYFTKYNAMGRTELVWDGAEATGLTLAPGNSSALGDTLLLSGTAQCATGTYNFHVVAYNAQNKETSRESGKIIVSTKIQRQTPDSLVEGFTGEEIEDIQFRYYALSADSVTLTWNRVAPAGISDNGANGIYTITGTPTQTGDFPFTISVKSGNNIVGMLRVQNSELGEHPILYLYKNSFDNAFYQNTKKNYNLIARKAKSTLRETAQYAAYDMIIISEDVDANNEEAMAASEGKIAKPVLNMKGFTYAADRLGWGDPDNGSIVNTKITVMQPTHPIFNGLNATEGGQIQILDTVTGKGLMPVKVEKDQSVCLATAAIRGRDYNSDGEQQTFLHEIPAAQRNGQKYLLFPLAAASSDKLNANGKKLLQNCIDYLKNNTVSPVVLPELQITSFTIGTTAATINQTDNTIELTVPKGTDLTAVTPVVTVKDSKTHAEPKRWNKDGITVDLSNDYMGLDYIVTDYINVRVYTVYAHVTEGLEEIYAEGEWINIYDIQGRKIMTTNESLHQLSLDRGMYIVVTPRGSFKIFR